MTNKNKLHLLTAAIFAALVLSFFISGRNSYLSGNEAFSGSSTGDDSQFLLDFDSFNSTKSSTMTFAEGESYKTSVHLKNGTVNILIKSEDGEIPYQGNVVLNGEFTVTIEKAGTYTFSVTGKRAKGSVHFTKCK